MREVDAGHAHTGGNHATNGFWAVGGGANGSNYLCSGHAISLLELSDYACLMVSQADNPNNLYSLWFTAVIQNLQRPENKNGNVTVWGINLAQKGFGRAFYGQG
jgi:hypothetical protein